LIVHSCKLHRRSEPCTVRKGPRHLFYSDQGPADNLAISVFPVVLKEAHGLQPQYSAAKPACYKQS